MPKRSGEESSGFFCIFSFMRKAKMKNFRSAHKVL